MSEKLEIYRLHNVACAPVSPVVFDSPHSGLTLPRHFKFDCPPQAMNKLTDMHVEKLIAGIKTIPVLEARIHRTCIDLNRFEDEFEAKEVLDGWNGPLRETKNTRNGLGLFPRDLKVIGVLTRIYNESSRPTAKEVQNRIDWYHRPYYDKLYELLDRAHEKNGFNVHINMHSMIRPQKDSTDIILGDLFGASCHPLIGNFARRFFENEGLSVSFNAPYSGGALVKQTHAPAKGRHSLQIEIAEDLYMHAETLAYQPAKAARIEAILTKFAAALHSFSLAHAAQLKPQAPGRGLTP